MKKQVKRCEHCDAKMVSYRHAFNKGLASGLFELHISGGGPISLRNLKLTRTQWTNFQKLRYWDLVEKTGVDGEWKITTKGNEFITSGTSIQKWVWTYRGQTDKFEGDTCFFNDIHEPKFDKKEDYVRNSKPIG
jgi:hypothetical protein